MFVVVVVRAGFSVDWLSGGKLHAPSFPQQTRSLVRPSVFPCQVGVVKLERSRPTTSGRLDTLDGHYYYYKCRDEIKAKQMNIEGTEMVAALLGHQ